MDSRKLIIILLSIILAVFYGDIIKSQNSEELKMIKSAESSFEYQTMQNDKWNDIESFLDLIHKNNINTMEFYLFGAEKGYEKVEATNDGYLPFYQQKSPQIIDEIVPASNTYIRPGRSRKSTKYIVIHNTGMAAPTANADILSRSINNSTRAASWHFTVDDNNIYQQLGIDEVGWHAGNKEGNEYGIGIEIWVYKGIDFNTAMRNAAQLTAKLLIDYNLEFDAIKQHYDFTGKNCPQVIREAGRWEEFIELVKIEYLGQTKFADVGFKWFSMSPQVFDNHGRIIKKTNQIRYRVEVMYQGKTQDYYYTSQINY